LRAVEYGEVTRIGSSRPIRVDVRIVAATNEHLPDRVDKHQFRADLLDRLSFEVVTLPPLRARPGDVMVLADHFGRRMASEIGWEDWPGFTPEAIDALVEYRWPGNVRELRNVIERAVYRWEREGPIGEIQFDPFASPFRPRGNAASVAAAPASEEPSASEQEMPESGQAAPEEGGSDFKARIARFERELLAKAMGEARFNQRACAKALGLSYDQLRHALKRHGIIAGG
jgi:psp operon transcriptional activator